MLLGIDRSHATFLISVIGISGIIGRIGLGYLSDHILINRLYLYNINLMVCGISEYLPHSESPQLLERITMSNS